MTLNDLDKMQIIRLQRLLVKLRSFQSIYQKWFYLGYIENFVDEFEIRDQRTSVTEGSS